MPIKNILGPQPAAPAPRMPETDIIGAVKKKYKELKLGEPRPREPILPRGTRPVMPITAPRSMPLPKGPQLVPPLQREIRKRMMPRRRILV